MLSEAVFVGFSEYFAHSLTIPTSLLASILAGVNNKTPDTDKNN